MKTVTCYLILIYFILCSNTIFASDEPTLSDWPDWYIDRTVETLQDDNNKTLLIAANSLQMVGAQLPDPIIKALANRLIDDKVSEGVKSEIIGALYYSDNKLDDIFPTLLKYARGVESYPYGLWEIFKNEISTKTFMKHANEIEPIILKSEEDSSPRNVFDYHRVSELVEKDDFDAVFIELENSNYSLDREFINYLISKLKKQSDKTHAYLKKMTSIFKYPNIEESIPYDIETIFSEIIGDNPNAIVHLISILKSDSHRVAKREALSILRYTDEALEYLPILIRIYKLVGKRSLRYYFSYLGHNLDVDMISKIFQMLEIALNEKDYDTREALLSIISNIKEPDEKFLSVILSDSLKDNLFVESLKPFGQAAIPALRSIIRSDLIDEDTYYVALEVLAEFSINLPAVRTDINAALLKASESPMDNESFERILDAFRYGGGKEDPDFAWVKLAPVMKALQSTQFEYKYYMLDFLEYVADSLTSEELKIILEFGLSADADANKDRVAKILENADHYELSKILPILLEIISANDDIDEFVTSSGKKLRYEKANYWREWAESLFKTEKLKPFVGTYIDQFITSFNNAKSGDTHCALLNVFENTRPDASSVLPSLLKNAKKKQYYLGAFDGDLYTPILYKFANGGYLLPKYKSDILDILSMDESSGSLNNIITKKIFAIRILQTMPLISQEKDIVKKYLTHSKDEISFEAAKLLVLQEDNIELDYLNAMIPHLFKFKNSCTDNKVYHPYFYKDDFNYISTPCDIYKGPCYGSYYYNSNWITKYGKTPLETTLSLLDYCWGNEEYDGVARYLYYILSENSELSRFFIELYDERELSQSSGFKKDIEFARKRIDLFSQAWPIVQQHKKIQQGLIKAAAITAETNSKRWNKIDKKKLVKLGSLVSKVEPVTGKRIIDIGKNKIPSWLGKALFFSLLCHLLFWLSLLYLYPKHPFIRARFFWNKSVRKYLGIFYIELLVTFIPWIRQRLLRPFKPAMAEGADMGNFDPESYYKSSNVNFAGKEEPIEISDVIIEKGHHYLFIGISGLGKTMFLRNTFYNHREDETKTHIFLKASECNMKQGVDNVVIEAIREKVDPFPRDTGLIETFIYTGSLVVYIDGLNEASPEFRADLRRFLTTYREATILMTTQPIDWQPPENTYQIYLLPLQQNQRQIFLELYYEMSVEPNKIDINEFKKRCVKFFQITYEHSSRLSDEQQEVIEGILSNPMDLNVCSQLIVSGKIPNLLDLQQQQYDMMAIDFKNNNPNQSQFPIESFAETAYEITKMQHKSQISESIVNIDSELFLQATQCMARHRLIIPLSKSNQWKFRHDKIKDFFVVQTFLGEGNSKPDDHIDDPRFAGVYFLLASMLPSETANLLKDKLISYAFTNNRYTISKSFIEGLKKTNMTSKFKTDHTFNRAATECRAKQ